MSNVLILNASGIFFEGEYVVSCYYEGLINQLTKLGNNVLHIVTNDFTLKPFNGANQVASKSIKKKIFERVKAFNPDLVISFNHSSINGLDQLVDCPFIIWEADSVEFFSDKKYLKENSDRFHFVGISSSTCKDFQNIFSASSGRIARVKPATAILNKNEEKKYNINFIGNAFFNNVNVINSLKEYPELLHLLPHEIDQIDKIVEKYQVRSADIKFARTGFDRASIVCALAEHGIKLFGSGEWKKLEFISEDLMRAYDPRAVYSLMHNELIYNRSKISLNINHAQAKSGYSWRVADIMASSSVLLSNYSSDLEKDFPNIKFQFYHSRAEAFDLAKKLLSDSEWRKDLILACNYEIDQSCRWSHCLDQISGFTDVKLVQPAQKQGSYHRLKYDLSILDLSLSYLTKIAMIKDLFKNLLIKILPNSFYYHTMRIYDLYLQERGNKVKAYE